MKLKFIALVFEQLRTGVRWSDAILVDNRSLRNNVKEFNSNITLKPGFAFTLSKRIQPETVLLPLFTAQYRNIETTNLSWNNNKTEKTRKGFDVNTSLSNNTNLVIGIRVLLGK